MLYLVGTSKKPRSSFWCEQEMRKGPIIATSRRNTAAVPPDHQAPAERELTASSFARTSRAKEEDIGGVMSGTNTNQRPTAVVPSKRRLPCLRPSTSLLSSPLQEAKLLQRHSSTPGFGTGKAAAPCFLRVLSLVEGRQWRAKWKQIGRAGTPGRWTQGDGGC